MERQLMPSVYAGRKRKWAHIVTVEIIKEGGNGGGNTLMGFILGAIMLGAVMLAVAAVGFFRWDNIKSGGDHSAPAAVHVKGLALVLPAAPAAEPVVDASTQAQQIIPLEAHIGVYVVPVLMNGVLTMKFIVDSGSADVSIPAEVAATLKRLGTISNADFLGSTTYILADGSKVSSETYRISSLKIGGLAMQNVTVRIASGKSGLLLGQSFLMRLKSWSVDNNRQVLIIN
jgi:clan AA aspartic protease (TIGR02281 family)